jgi:hypothetical protein
MLALCSGSQVDDKNKAGLRNTMDNLPSDMIRKIAGFLEHKDMSNWRNVNTLTRLSLPLKAMVYLIFDISGPGSISDNEPELQNIMRLSWISRDYFLCFTALMEEVVSEKKSYNVLFRPLILHLLGTFRALGHQQQQRYSQYFYNRFRTYVERYLASLCAKKGHFDLVFEIAIARNDAQVLKELVSSLSFENREDLIELFRAKPEYANQCLNALLAYGDKYTSGSWISECIINDLPLSYFEKLFIGDHEVFESMTNYLFFSVNVPEFEYGRIHNQVSMIFDIYSGEMPMIAVLRMINDIRFGLFDLNDFQAVNLDFIKDNNQFLQIAKAALLANKRDLFLDIYAKYKPILGYMSEIVDFWNLNFNSLQAKSFKIIFDMIQANSHHNFQMIQLDSAAILEIIQTDPDFIPNSIQPDPNNIFESSYSLLSFVTKFYAVKSLKLEGNLVTLKFVVSENLLEFGFPSDLEIVKPLDHVYNFIDVILTFTAVFNESTIVSFIPDLMEYYENISRPKKYFSASIELIEFISNSTNLLQLILENGIKFYANLNLERYFNMPNQEIFQYYKSYCELPKMKTKDHIEKMELSQGVSVDEIYREREGFIFDFGEINRGNAKLMYFEWRTVFDYWLNHRAGNGMRQIRIPEFIEMLKLDFPNKTKELFAPEQSQS